MLAFTSVYFFESGLFNGLRPIQIKKIPFLSARQSGRLRNVSRVRPSLVDTSDFHQAKYTEGSRISQGFVRCNRMAQPKDRTLPTVWSLRGGPRKVAGTNQVVGAAR